MNSLETYCSSISFVDFIFGYSSRVFQAYFVYVGKDYTVDFENMLPSVIKVCSSVFSEILSNLATLYFAEGHFPARFKHEQVTKFLEKECLEEVIPANYRPMSNFETLSYITERLALTELRQHLIGSPNFNPTQSPYHRQYSTEISLPQTTNATQRTIYQG